MLKVTKKVTKSDEKTKEKTGKFSSRMGMGLGQLPWKTSLGQPSWMYSALDGIPSWEHTDGRIIHYISERDTLYKQARKVWEGALWWGRVYALWWGSMYRKYMYALEIDNALGIVVDLWK